MQSTGKQWFQMAPNEKHALWRADEAKARAMMDAPITHNGKTWEQLDNSEKAALYNSDKPTFLAMQEEVRYGR